MEGPLGCPHSYLQSNPLPTLVILSEAKNLSRAWPPPCLPNRSLVVGCVRRERSLAFAQDDGVWRKSLRFGTRASLPTVMANGLQRTVQVHALGPRGATTQRAIAFSAAGKTPENTLTRSKDRVNAGRGGVERVRRSTGLGREHRFWGDALKPVYADRLELDSCGFRPFFARRAASKSARIPLSIRTAGQRQDAQ